MANRYFSTSIGRKVLMALSALFLLVFLLQHFLINILSVFSPAAFNSASHFMGTFWLIQYIFQPILIAGVLFHFIMGFVLELQNRNAREVRYAFNKPSANSTWMSRNMMWSGLTILAFLVLHFIDFWIPEMVHKYVETNPEDPTRYYHELVVKFENPIRVGAYVVAFVLLAMHLLHGFQSAFQSVGLRHPKYLGTIKTLGKLYAIILPLGFIFIALFHYVRSL